MIECNFLVATDNTSKNQNKTRALKQFSFIIAYNITKQEGSNSKVYLTAIKVVQKYFPQPVSNLDSWSEFGPEKN